MGRPAPSREIITAKRINPANSPDWDYLAAGALFLGVVVIMAATVAEDIVTGGLGVANDAASFAIASAMLTEGITLINKKVNTSIPIQVEGQQFAHDEI